MHSGATYAGSMARGRSSVQPERLWTPATIGVLVLASAFCARLLTVAGAPAILKFVHFAVAWGGLVVVSPGLRSRSSRRLLVGLFVLAAVILLSAAVNGAGFVNAFLHFLLLSEPFVLLLLLTDGELARGPLRAIRSCVSLFALTTVAMSWYQFGVHGRTADAVQGVFLDRPGAHVNGAVAMIFAVYLLVEPTTRRRAATLLAAAAAMGVGIIADAKQVFAGFFAAQLALFAPALLRPRKIVRAMAVMAASALTLVLLASTVMPAMRNYAQLDFISSGIEYKLSVFPRIAADHESQWNWVFGLGPGHSASRLAWLIPKYHDYLAPLGVTTSNTTGSLVSVDQASWLAQTSFWSMMFSWAGVWGDLGILGLLGLAVLWMTVWREFCHDHFSRFIVLNVLIFGAIHAWVEEPAFMLFAIAMVASRWRQLETSRVAHSSPS